MPREPVKLGPRDENVAVDAGARAPDPDLAPTTARKLLSIDWSSVPMSTDAEANAVWATIAPTGDDWDRKLDEVPVASARPLALAMLHAGNFACMKPQPLADCMPLVLEVDPPAPAATMSDPCLRRMLALWAIAQLEDEDVPGVMDALRGIAALPPPESQLVAAAIEVVPEHDHAARLELMAIAHRAGQRELANGKVSTLDEPHLITAVQRHHLEGALDLIAAGSHRPVFLAAITDEALAPAARAQALVELVDSEDPLSKETRTALVAAAKSKDCLVAATAARALDARGDRRFVPRRPRTRSPAIMLRGLCVLASFERLKADGEPSLLGSFLPAKGLELIETRFDALAEVDTDGDGDPRTERTTNLVGSAEAVLPELDDLVRAFRSCKGTTCSSADRDFRFTFKPAAGQLYLARIEVAERPTCPMR